MNANKLLDKLKPYFENGVLTDTLYVGNDVSIFCYGDVGYMACINIKDDVDPIAIPVGGKKDLKKYIRNEKRIYVMTSYLLKNRKEYIYVLNNSNLQPLKEHVLKCQAMGMCYVDFKFNEKLKRKYIKQPK